MWISSILIIKVSEDLKSKFLFALNYIHIEPGNALNQILYRPVYGVGWEAV